MRRGRYCRVTTCPNFKGAKKSTPMFNTPSFDPPLRDKWIRWLRTVEPKFDERLVGLNFNLCDLHFDTDDMRRAGDRFRLVPGTIPKYFIPHPDPLANAESTSGDELNSEKVTPSVSTESPSQSSNDQTIEVDLDKDMTSNVPKKPKKTSYCTKCINVNVDVQSLKVKLSKSENRLTNQKSIIDSLRNMLNELKKAQKSEIPKIDVCHICCEKLPAGSLYEHLCVETNDEDLTIFKTDDVEKMIKCAYCTRSFTATIKLTEHLKFSHMIKAYTASCNQCEQHYAMEELLQVHMMAKHKKKVSKRTPTQTTQLNTPIPMPPLNDGTQLIALELEKPEESEPQPEPQSEPVEMIIEEPSEQHLESPEWTPKRMRLEGESSTISEHSYSSDANDIAEVLPSNDYDNENQTNEVNNKPQLRRLKIIKKKNAIEPTSVPDHLPAMQETIKITVEPMPMAVDKDDPLSKPYECGSCGERFVQPQELNQHMRRYHGIAGNRVSVECYQCFERLPNMKDLKKHLLTFHEKEPSKDKSRLCDQCGLVCRTKQQMEIHCKSHKNAAEKPSKKIKSLNGNPYCDICKISFQKRTTYWRHSLKHKDDQGKKYACDQCPMRFVDMSQFKSHSNMHTGEKPYQCEYCEPKRLFRYKKGLKTHLRMHFGVYIYGCEIQNCQERFQYHKELQEHMKNHHD